MAQFNLEIVTPDRKFFDDKVDMVIVRGIDGDLAILKGRAPIATPLRIGKVRVFQDDTERIGAIVDGYITVLNDKVTIVTDAAEWPDEIDVERAEKAKERAESRLDNKKKDIDIPRAEAALRRAINRLNVSEFK
ncbi:MAG TPA: F0F1 ATP synthase subunit epsilon [Tissierellaceae bacterium]|nr:F0F1 ATP synthase subunit epsilon [Tissierellaceae bacterium]